MNICIKSIKINIKNNISWKNTLIATKEITSFLLNKIKEIKQEKKQAPTRVVQNAVVFRTGKTTAIRRTAVREASVSQHHGGPIEGPLRSPVQQRTIVLRSISGTLNWALIIPRDAGLSLSDSQCQFFLSGINSHVLISVHSVFD